MFPPSKIISVHICVDINFDVSFSAICLNMRNFLYYHAEWVFNMDLQINIHYYFKLFIHLFWQLISTQANCISYMIL